MRDDVDSGLFSAVVAVAAGLELGATLRRIVQAAADLGGYSDVPQIGGLCHGGARQGNPADR